MFQARLTLTECMSGEKQQKPLRCFISLFKLKEIFRDIDVCKPSPLPSIKGIDYKTHRIYKGLTTQIVRVTVLEQVFLCSRLIILTRKIRSSAFSISTSQAFSSLSRSIWLLLFCNGLMPENLQLSSLFFLIPEDLSSYNKEKNILEEPVPNSFLKIWLMYRHTTLLCLTSICLHYFGIIHHLIGMPFKYTSLFSLYIHMYFYILIQT